MPFITLSFTLQENVPFFMVRQDIETLSIHLTECLTNETTENRSGSEI